MGGTAIEGWVGGWGVGCRGLRGGGGQNLQERGGSGGCFIFMSWLVGAFDLCSARQIGLMY